MMTLFSAIHRITRMNIEELEDLVSYADEYYNNEQYKDAILYYEKAISIGGGFHPHCMLGVIYKDFEEYSQATKYFKKAIELYQGEEDLDLCYAYLGMCLESKEKKKEAQKAYLKALEINPKSEIGLYFWTDFLERKMDKHQEAFAVIQDLLEINSENGEYRMLYADILTGLDKHQEASKEYQKALELDNENALIWNNYGVFLLNIDNPYQAKECFYKACEFAPNVKLYKENLKIAITRSASFWRTIDKIMKPFNCFKYAGFILLLITIFPKLAKIIYKSGILHHNRTLEGLLILAVIIFLLFGALMIVANIITSVLIKLKILR